MRTALFGLLTAAAVTAPWLPAAAHDSTWPPEKDPQATNENHEPSSPVYIGNIAFDYPEEYEDWFDHNHGPNYDGTFAFGDVLGVDDGEQHVVLAMPGEAVLAAKYTIDFPTQTGTLEPIWFWLSPYGRDADYYPTNHRRWQGFNVLIDDFDGDGRNEVAVNSAEIDFVELVDPPQPPPNDKIVHLKPVMFLLQTDEQDPPPPSPFLDGGGQPYPDPAPVELARTFPDPLSNQWAERLGNCKVRDVGRQIAMHEHHDGSWLPIWEYTNPSGVQGQGQLDLIYRAEIFNPNNTLGANSVKTHEFNYVDVDGDGFDEFFMDGLLDFVDRDPVTGLAVPTNVAKPQFGVLRWTSGYSINSGHFDQLFCADWDRDPNDTGHPMELLALTEGAGGSVPWPNVVDLFLEPETGALISENVNAPAKDPQEALGGNFTRTRPGLEVVFVPKDFGTPAMNPPGQVDFSGSYAIDAQQDELAIDGVNFGNVQQNVDYPLAPVIGRMSTGPATPRPMAIDWDGERTQDEVMATPWSTINVWGLRDKADLALPYPPGFPLESDLIDVPTNTIKTFTIDGNEYSVWYYQGNLGQPHPEWAWNNGGPGRHSHFWEKLGEIFPFRTVYEAIPFDVGGDHREEIVVMNAGGLYFLYNPDPLGVDPVVSPSILPAYRRHRMEENIMPFAFDELPELTGVEIRPADDTLPSTVVGMRLRKKLQLKAMAHFSDGTSVDVTRRVTWIDDPETSGDINFSPNAGEEGLLVSKLVRVSARVQAELPYGTTGASMKSNFMYVQASNLDQPEVLMAGFAQTYLDEGNTNALTVSALVAQRDNHTNLMVPVLNTDNTFWRPFGQDVYLHDDGLNGDSFANDGVWTVQIAPGPQDGNMLSFGANLLMVKAAWPENLLFMSQFQFTGGPDFHVSDAWPYKTFGSLTLYPSPAPPAPVDEAVAFWAPRVLVSGMRGYHADPDKVLIEAVVTPAHPLVADPDTPVTVVAYLPWSATYVTLVDRGLGVHSLLVDASSAPNGTYVIPVQASVEDTSAMVWPSDFWPYLYLHNVIP